MKSEDTFPSVVHDVFVRGGLHHPQGRVIATRVTRGDAESRKESKTPPHR